MNFKDANYDYVEQNLLALKRRIANICKNCGRDSNEIYIIAVSKTFPVEAVSFALDYNQLDFGENRVQELLNKQKKLEHRIINWHLVGHLQTNKVKYIVPFIFLIHSVDSFKLALKINSEAAKVGKKIKFLIQVNTSGEMQKSGCSTKEALKLAKEISGLPNIKLRGLMTIAKMITDKSPEKERNIVRGNFRSVKNIFDEIKSLDIPQVEMKYLSMGMTSDYEIAVEEGSNMLRIGTAIFGERTTQPY
jgi:pyridoxal phosphate enzyme (YggS family)